MRSFNIDDTVIIKRDIWSGGSQNRNLKGDSFTIKDVEHVPTNEIDYNPHTQEGGVGHHQLLTIEIDGVDRTLSGLFFT